MTYDEAKATRDALDADVARASAVLRQFPKVGPFNLTPDLVRASAEYRKALDAYSVAFERLRKFNAVFVKEFAAEIRAERSHKRGTGNG